MRRTFGLILPLALSLASCAPAGQQAAQPGADQTASVDANHDGEVDQQEYTVAVLATFDELDVNRDGTVTQGEVFEVFRARDLDGDSRLSPDEAGPLLMRLDRNGDGYLTRDELAFPLTWSSGGGVSPSTAVQRQAAQASAMNDFVAMDRNSNQRLVRSETTGASPLIVVTF